MHRSTTDHRVVGAAALQQAQRSVLTNRRTVDPDYWAPFILMGGR